MCGTNGLGAFKGQAIGRTRAFDGVVHRGLPTLVEIAPYERPGGGGGSGGGVGEVSVVGATRRFQSVFKGNELTKHQEDCKRTTYPSG